MTLYLWFSSVLCSLRKVTSHVLPLIVVFYIHIKNTDKYRFKYIYIFIQCRVVSIYHRSESKGILILYIYELKCGIIDNKADVDF